MCGPRYVSTYPSISSTNVIMAEISECCAILNVVVGVGVIYVAADSIHVGHCRHDLEKLTWY